MSERFPLHTEETAPDEAVSMLRQSAANLGITPNLERVMASAPALLTGYVKLWELFDQTSLSPVERQIVYQVANFENECNYCVPWHTQLSLQAGMSTQDVEALRNGSRLSDERLEALRLFTRSLIRTRGKIAQADLDQFMAAGWQPQQALEVILGVAVKTMSNFTNSIAGTPLDKAVQEHGWSKPVIPMRD
jgi:uncharacterized peroxidase-related enzyme